MNFKGFLINEKKKQRTEYGCVMLGSSDISDWKDKHLSIIKEEDIFNEGNDHDGLCDLPHVTLLWGVHEDEVDSELMKNFITAIPETEVSLTDISIFENDKYDVVKYSVESDDLHKYRKLIESILPNTQTFDGYHPHMTLARVIKGRGKDYVKTFKEKEIKTIKLNEVIYSYDTQKNKTYDLEKI